MNPEKTEAAKKLTAPQLELLLALSAENGPILRIMNTGRGRTSAVIGDVKYQPRTAEALAALEFINKIAVKLDAPVGEALAAYMISAPGCYALGITPPDHVVIMDTRSKKVDVDRVQTKTIEKTIETIGMRATDVPCLEPHQYDSLLPRHVSRHRGGGNGKKRDALSRRRKANKIARAQRRIKN